MVHNALRADDVSWLLRTVKNIQQCVAFGCSNQAKNRKDTRLSISFNKPIVFEKATHCSIVTLRSNHDTSSARSALRAIAFKMAAAGILNGL